MKGIMKMKSALIAWAALVLWAGVAEATPDTKDLLIKFADAESLVRFTHMTQAGGARIESLGGGNWIRVQLKDQQKLSVEDIRKNPNVLAVQPNYRLRIYEDYRAKDKATREAIAKLLKQRTRDELPFPIPGGPGAPAKDNPDIPRNGTGGAGEDPEFAKQWGINDIGVKLGWKAGTGNGMIVAVIDTGVDYTHEDLIDNLWRNAGETGKDAQGRDKEANGVDDDGNGYIDDTIGWDFVTNDNKPFDLSLDPIQILLGGGNPGHGTHCAGNVGARTGNGKGVVGVAPNVKMMTLRFLSEKGQGDTAGAVKSINYAVKMGAKVLSNSWGSEGEDPKEGEANKALRDAIAAAEQAGVLFVAAAGNGHQGVGYDNDTDPKPAVPASYPHENIISVAALNNADALGSFSNWGRNSVDLGAPGVAVFSTTVGSKYSDTVIDMFGLKVTWDGTSMATPHVAGAAALYWSKHPTATWRQVKQAILSSTKPISALSGKSVTGGKLNVDSLMTR